MHNVRLITLKVCFCLTVALSQAAYGSGELVPGDDHGCYGNGPENATYTPTRFTYVSAGYCSLTRTRLNLDVTVHWTGVGTYDPATGQTAEDIIVPAPRIDEPSRPYGHFQATLHCSADPWLNPNIQCDHIVPTVYAPLDNTAPNAKGWKQPYPLAPIIAGTIQQTRRPYTATMSQDAVNKLNRQYGVFEAQQKAERQSQKLQRELQIRPGFARPRGIEGEQPSEPQPSEPAAPEQESGTKP